MEVNRSRASACKISCLTVLALCVFAERGSDAAEIRANVNAGIGISDNIGLDDSNEIDETYGIYGLVFDFEEQTTRTDARIRAELGYMQYFDDTFDDELVGGVDALASFSLVPERLSWMFQENFGQQTLDPFAPPRPSNREDVNYLTTGPNLSLPLGARTLVGVNLRYSEIAYETRPFDNDKASANVNLQRYTSENTTLSLNALTERTEYDNGELASDYDRREAYIRYSGSSTRNVVGIDIGFTEIDLNDDTGDGVLARVDWTRIISPFSTFTVSGRSQFSDQGDIFRFNQISSNNLTDTGEFAGFGTPFLSNSIDLGYALDRDRTTATLRLGWSQEDYRQGGDLDRDITRIEAYVRRELSQNFFGILNARFKSRDFKYQAQENDDMILRVTLGYEIEPALEVSLSYNFFERDSEPVDGSFRENRVFLRIAYSPAWGRN